MQRRREPVPVGLIMFLLLLLLVGIRGDILEGDCAFNLLASEDCLVVPPNKYTDVAGLLGWGHLGGQQWSLSEDRQLRRNAR